MSLPTYLFHAYYLLRRREQTIRAASRWGPSSILVMFASARDLRAEFGCAGLGFGYRFLACLPAYRLHEEYTETRKEKSSNWNSRFSGASHLPRRRVFEA